MVKKILGWGVVLYLTTQLVGAAVGAFVAVHYGNEVAGLWLTVSERISDAGH
jgi:hypothetical protein